MAFEDVMAKVSQWREATQALAATGAQLAAQGGEVEPPAEVAAALRDVIDAAGLDGLAELPPQQRGIALALIRAFLHSSLDVLDHADRDPSWTHTDPAILDGWGRASMMMPTLMSNAHPDLASVTSVLDVGTGVGLLAVAATRVWPDATVVGIDTWETSLERARTNVAQAGVEDRVTLRCQDLADLDDTDAYDCVWLPTFFLSQAALDVGVPAVVRALRPGGLVVLAYDPPTPTPLAAALQRLEQVRIGAVDLDAVRALELLEKAGCEEVHEAPIGPAPVALALGRRPAQGGR